MNGTLLLQIFLYLNVFAIGVLVTLGVQHGLAHFKPKPAKVDKPKDTTLPAELREQLLQRSQADFEAVLNRSATDLQRDLNVTGDQLNKALGKLGSAMVGNELERYHADLEQIRKRAQDNLSGAQTELEQHQTELRSKMEADVAAEQARLTQQLAADHELLRKQIDTRLGDAVASFLLETMQHNVDLGAQSAYLTEMLETHKADLQREVTS